MFSNIKEFTTAKSPNKKGVLNAYKDHIEEGIVPLVPAFKINKDKDWFLILVTYKKEITCLVN